MRVDISHLACCLTTFHKPDPDFQEMEMKMAEASSEEPQSKKGTAALLKDAISTVTLESPDCLTYWSSILGARGSGSNRSLGLVESSLC